MINPSIRARLNQHITAAYAIQYRTIMGGIFEQTPHWMRGLSGLSIPTFNIFHPLTHKGLDDELLADTAAFFSSHNMLYSIELVHDRFPEGPDYLDQRRYQSLPPQPAMVLEDFSTVKDEFRLNPAITTERIQNVPSLTAFCALLHQVFDFPLRDTIKLFPVAHLEKEARHKIRHYLAFDNDKPVGTGTSICLDGIVSVWHVCTLDACRRQGVATTLMHRILSDALASDASVAMLYSTPQAYHLFNKLGFDIYTQRQWFLPPGLHYLDD
jgi:ribosomal protein S18 acetylase RimI-like enzyme